MKTLIFKKQTPQGLVDGTLRVIGKYIFFKYNDTKQSKAVLEDFRKKGLDVELGKGWVKVNLFKNNDVVKLGTYEIDLEEDKKEEVENKLFNFYKQEYTKLGFYLEEK